MPRRGYIFSKERIDAIAENNNYDELNVHPNNIGRMCSYESREDSVKIHVYLKTGTVATCLDHPRSGKTQLFRRNNNLADIADIFATPRRHTGRGYYQLSGIGHIDSHCVAAKRLSPHSRDALRNLRSKLNEKTVHSISMGVDSFFILYSDGTFNYNNIPTYLQQKLARMDFEEDPIPEVVSLGSHHEDSYFIQFADGTQSYRHLPANLERHLENSDSKVDIIGFGANEALDRYYVRFLDGNVHKSLPERLNEKLENRYCDLEISRVSFGCHRGRTSYAVEFSNGHQDQRAVHMEGETFWNDFDRTSPEYVVVGNKGNYIMME